MFRFIRSSYFYQFLKEFFFRSGPWSGPWSGPESGPRSGPRSGPQSGPGFVDAASKSWKVMETVSSQLKAGFH